MQAFVVFSSIAPVETLVRARQCQNLILAVGMRSLAPVVSRCPEAAYPAAGAFRVAAFPVVDRAAAGTARRPAALCKGRPD